MSNLSRAAKPQVYVPDSGVKTQKTKTKEPKSMVLDRAGTLDKVTTHQRERGRSVLNIVSDANPSPVTFEQAYQHVGWQYNAGGDIIINVQSPDQLATELAEMQKQIKQGFEHQVISGEEAEYMQQKLDAILKHLRSDQPQAEAILSELKTSRAYLQEASVKLAQQIPQEQSESGVFRLVVGIGAIVAIAFDLGATSAVVAGLFGLVVRSI